jgi:hypothetical protein
MDSSDNILFGAVYIPPNCSIYSSPDAFHEIEMEYFEFRNHYTNVCLLGDMNYISNIS